MFQSVDQQKKKIKKLEYRLAKAIVIGKEIERERDTAYDICAKKEKERAYWLSLYRDAVAETKRLAIRCDDLERLI